MCADARVDLVFAPAPDAMYPPGFETHVEVEGLTTLLEGAFRPGHFRGVTTIVAKLFCLVGRSVAVFGRKDYQQWRVLDRMARDLGMPIEVVGRPTIREADGLALSSRNRYLDARARDRALAISRGLRDAWDAWARGERDAERLVSLARAPVEVAFDRIDYVAGVSPTRSGPRRDRSSASRSSSRPISGRRG
jgi:pantoate--beta-alanine ligase